MTALAPYAELYGEDFNPHEREARDPRGTSGGRSRCHFNPHEREARDGILRSVSAGSIHFNPHEREARDEQRKAVILFARILIHTSVKLVTPRFW